MSNLILPAGPDLTLPPSMQMRQVEKVGPIAVGALLPWHGMLFHVVKIEANDNLDFTVTLAPGGPTSGALKRMTGKKGKSKKRGRK